MPNPPIAPPPVPFCAASPCIFSLTFRLTSKNLLTHRSRHTLSPLLRSASRYSGGMHFLVQDCDSLFNVGKIETSDNPSSCKGYRNYLLNMSETISTSVSAAAIFSAEESWGRPPKRKDIVIRTDCFSVCTLRKTFLAMAIWC